MPHLGGTTPGPNMHWDYKNQLRQTDLGGGGTAFYVYDASGQRVRKVWEKAPGLIEERIYVGGFEIFRKHGSPVGANTATLERETLHVMDDKQRIALIETRTLDTANVDRASRQIIRYQFGNHLGSASLELDDQAQIISYEEYTPYGSSAYQAVRTQTETSKRYRYTGKERDEESGFYYHGARYYAAWLGKWTAADPANLKDGLNLYRYVEQNPVRFRDASGAEGEPSTDDIVNWAAMHPERVQELLSAPMSSEGFMAVVLAEVRRSIVPPQSPSDPRCRPMSDKKRVFESSKSPVAGPMNDKEVGDAREQQQARDRAEYHENHPNQWDKQVGDMQIFGKAAGPAGDSLAGAAAGAYMLAGQDPATAKAKGALVGGMATLLPAGRGAASKAAAAEISPGPAVQVGTTGETPITPAAAEPAPAPSQPTLTGLKNEPPTTRLEPDSLRC